LDETGYQRVTQDVSLWQLLQIPNYTFAAITGGWAYFQYHYNGPILSIRLAELGCPPDKIFFFFLLSAIANVITSLILSFARFPYSKRTLMIVSMLASTFAHLFMGPSTFFHFPQTLQFIGVGLVLLGIFNPALLIFSLPEMVDVIDTMYFDLDGQSKMKIYDTSSGIYNAILGIGQILGPIYATTMTSTAGFSLCCDFVAVTCLTLGILYLIFTKKELMPSGVT
jgi:hypothetical protein